MNKKELIAAIAENNDLEKKEVSIVFDACFDTIKEALAEGEKITLVGFGSFDTKVRAARTGRNPQTGEAMEIEEKTAVSFKPGKALKDYINE